MRKFNTLHLLRLCFVAVFAMLQTLALAQSEKDMAPGKILVKFKPAAVARIQQNSARLTNVQPGRLNTGLAAFDAAAGKLKASGLKRVFPNAGKMEAKQRKYGLDKWYVLEVDKSASVKAALASFKNLGELEYAEPVYRIASINPTTVKPLGAPVIKPMGAASVNDPFYSLQWHYENTGQTGGYKGADINLPNAWKITGGTPNVIVDIVDGGVDYAHEDLAANMWKNEAELNGQDGVDDDNNGYVDDIYGYNFADKTAAIAPGDHGTHVAGTVAAVNNNGIGVAGVAGGTGIGDGARLMSSQIFGANSPDGAASAAAIVYGANNGAVISQNSWGYTSPGVYAQVVLDAVDYFTKEAGRDENGIQTGPMNGGVVFFASGNDNINDESYPGYYPATVAVSATTVFDNKSSFSNYGSWVDISAPGGELNVPNNQQIASTVVGNKYGYLSGTSMACPHVSGVAALIVSKFGKQGFSNEDLKNRLFATVDKFIALNPAYNGLMGIGRLNAGRAVEPDQALPPAKILDLAGISNTQNSIDLTWTAPSDPDNTNAQNYTVYYATHSFDSTQKDTIKKIIIPKALAAGTKENFNLSGLVPSTDYYIAVAAKDLWGNEASLSTVVKVTTMQGAIISLPSGTITMNINVETSPQQSASLQFGNNGKGTLDWASSAVPVSSEWARQDGFNDTLLYTQYSWVGGYVGDDEATPFSAATRFYVKGKPFNLTHIGNGIQTQGVEKPIWAYVYKGGEDPSKGTLLIKQQITGAPQWGGLHISKLDGMFLFQPGEWFWIVYEYDGEYGHAQGYESGAADSLAGNFLFSSNNGKTWATISSVFQPVKFYTYALSNDGYFGGFVTMQPNTGSVAGNASANVKVNANAATVRNGTYHFRLQFNSNDLNNPMASVPLIVNVSGQKATLATNNGLFDCGNVFLGKTAEKTVKLYNAGLSKLYNLTFSSSNNLFTKVALPDTLYPGDSASLTISFKPEAAGPQQAVITIGSNGGSINLSATGNGVEPPALSLSGVPVQIVAKADSTGKNSFIISNKNGKYPLNYSFPEVAAIKKAKAAGLLSQGKEAYGSYVWIDDKEPGGPVYNWNDISLSGMDITAQLSADARTAKLFNLGFAMPVYGDTISQLYVTGMGMLSFNYPGAMNVFGTDLPQEGDGINGCIAPLWSQESDPVLNTGMKVFVKYEPGKFIVQYNDVEKFEGGFWGGGSFSLGKATYQVILYSDGKVAVNYKDISTASWAYSAMIGIENKTETKGFNVSYFLSPTPWNPTDNSSIWFVPVTPDFISSVKPLNGAVAPGDSVSVEVTASAKGLVDSVYTNTLALTTNDPVNESLDIPVILTVTGVQGVLQKTDSLHFGDVYNGGSAAQDAIFLNTGSKPVKLVSVTFDNTAFSTNIQPVNVPAFSELRIPVTFKPTAVNDYAGTVTVVTDNPSQTNFTFYVNGKGIAAPGIQYSLEGGQSKTLNINETADGKVKITNNGASDLKVMLQHPQWLQLPQDGKGVGNGLANAHTYTVHKSMDSATAAYNWIELADGLGTPTIVDQQAPPYQEIKLPFSLPFYGKNYQSVFLNYWGDVYLENPGNALEKIKGGLPAPTAPNGFIATANVPMYRSFNFDTRKYDGEIYYHADTNRLVIEFYKVIYFNFFASGTVTYEVIIYKDGRIKTQYKEGETTANYTHNFTVGIENQDGTDGIMAFNQTAFWKDKGAIEFVPSLAYTVKAGESIELPVTWTTTSMTDGVYKDWLRIATNDPLQQSVDIPLELTVTGSYDTDPVDTIAYGNVIAAVDGNGMAKQYSKPFTISNKGYKTVTLNSATFSSDKLAFNWDVSFPVVLAPGETYKTNVFFTPDATLTSFNEKLTVTTDQPGMETFDIPVTAAVALPPVITTDSAAINIVMQQGDTAVRYLQINNEGESDLNYSLGFMYRRPGITYNSLGKPVIINKTQPKQGQHIGTYGAGGHAPISLFGTQDGNFADSIIMPVPGNNFIEYMGSSDDNNPITTVTRFNTGGRSFNLSHIGNGYRTSSLNNGSATLRIRLGSNINSSTVVREQTVQLPADTSGTYITVKLDSALLLYPNEDFWVEWEYANGMQFPQAVQFVPNDQVLQGSFYYKFPFETAFSEDFYPWRYVVNAYAQDDSSANKGWLMVEPSAPGTVQKGKSQELTVTVTGPLVPPPAESADIIIRSNDINTPEAKVRVNVRIDQAPYLTRHDTLTVNEGDTLRYAIPAKDDENGEITITATDTENVAIEKDSVSRFVYTPGYADSGWHWFEIELSDNYNNKRKDTLLVNVLNINRAPKVTGHTDTLTLYVGSAAWQKDLNTVFSDEDGDTLTYSFNGDTTSLADVFVSGGLLSIIPKDSGTVQLRFTATDPFAAAASDTLVLVVKRNTVPEASAIPNLVVEAGAPPRRFDVSAWFSDADGDALTYTATVDSAALATASFNGSDIALTGITAGNTIVHVTASDGNGGTVTGSFMLTVLNNKGNIVNDYHITVAPNPVRSIANIRFQLGTDKKVRIDLLGMNGKLQAVLFDGNKQAGNQSIQANLSGLAAGNYLLRFTIDGKTGIVQIAKL
ncbi:S8 family serine peptidase [Foetidibacter luteolus]|uniref:S8 family serine peptidase n=1 Tax=Foetidibacter luteolus TaxID=2608880 RepID=UPI00129A4EC4|nr:S8 family serine peptidase [Foetidibacter luteolus]